jgi:uncharacterized protein
MEPDMNERTCIVTRLGGDPERLIRFVVGPDSDVVPDLKRKLPGRGCWVTAERSKVEKAATKNLFARAFRRPVSVPADLAGMVDRQLAGAALGMLGLARKAGSLVTGATKVESAVRSGRAEAVLHAVEASPDGLRKMAQARRALEMAGGDKVPCYILFSEAEMGLALGGTNVIHAAVIAGPTGETVLKRLDALARFREISPDDGQVFAASNATLEAAEDME